MLEVVRTIGDVRRLITAARRRGRRIGVVPTMGALHEGHLSLIRRAVDENDVVVVTIFVNPSQFAPDEDFADYPRTIDEDLDQCRKLRVDIVFRPEVAEMYYDDACTTVEVHRLATILEGLHRPTHFRGVTTVVLKLFSIVAPDVAYFGRKDYQQQAVVRRMCRDLNVPVEIVTCPTVREPDGLALSSRNRLLSATQRASARGLFQSLTLACERLRAGETDVGAVRQAMLELLHAETGLTVDYVTLADPVTLEELSAPRRKMVALVAARIGTVRLIDNLPIELDADT